MKNINCYEFQSFCKEMKRFILNFCFNFEYIKENRYENYYKV